MPKALGEREPQALEQGGLGPIGLGDASQSELWTVDDGEHDVDDLDATEFLEQRPRAVAQTRSTLPALQGLPHGEGQEAHEDVRLDPLLLLVPDGPYPQVALVDPEGGFRLPVADLF